jgi:hypothetical protein
VVVVVVVGSVVVVVGSGVVVSSANSKDSVVSIGKEQVLPIKKIPIVKKVDNKSNNIH